MFSWRKEILWKFLEKTEEARSWMFHEDNAMEMLKWDCFYDSVSRNLKQRNSEDLNSLPNWEVIKASESRRHSRFGDNIQVHPSSDTFAGVYTVRCEIRKCETNREIQSIFLWINKTASTVEGDQGRSPSANMVDINSIIEGTVKFRDGKKVNISAIV